MSRIGSCFVVCLVLTRRVFAAPPPQEEAVQGIYEGTIEDAKGQQKVGSPRGGVG